MANNYRRKKQKYSNIFCVIATIIILCTVYLCVVGNFYTSAEKEAKEVLHLQTKQIKDSIELQLVSDRENLQTMAGFASKLYSDGEGYDLLFESFKPIGLIANIGILNPDNTLETKAGTVNLDGKISFEEEAKRGGYISGRVKDLTNDDNELIRSAVPITHKGETVGMLYGVIKLEDIDNKYSEMVEELNAQLFVCDKESGNLVIDSIHGANDLKNINVFEQRTYEEGSYEEVKEKESGFVSFSSIYNDGQLLYVHYSTIEEMNWKILLARYDSDVFKKVDDIAVVLFWSFVIMTLTIVVCVLFILQIEKQRIKATESASVIRKLLLEINQQQNNISAALQEIVMLSNGRSAVFFDADGDEYTYVMPASKKDTLTGKERKYFVGELLKYAAEHYGANDSTVGLMRIVPNKRLFKSNPEFHGFLKKHNLYDVSFATVTDKDNHINILGVTNPKNRKMSSMLLEDIAVCFSIAIFNKNHLNKTEIAATTDALTGVSNRVAYKKDLVWFDKEKPEDFACIYIDVNELHMRNNKYGHAAGDEMLLCIANTLKEVFYGDNVYRMGGDEFLVFAQNRTQEEINKSIEVFNRMLEIKDYNAALGVSYRTQSFNAEEMVREAEIRMYEAKAQYYQQKGKNIKPRGEENSFVQTKTGILEIDALLSVLKENYNGIYRVSLNTDKAHRILMPAYLGYNEQEENFSALLTRYVDETVVSECHRGVLSFLNYDAIKRQLAENKIPRTTYKKTNGETVVLSVYRLGDDLNDIDNTLWVFALDQNGKI